MRSSNRTYQIVIFLLALAAGSWSAAANAVPSFARQTGMACAACHTMFPELTAFGRQFKLDGYTMAPTPQITGGEGKAASSLQISATAPLSVMFQTSYTTTKGSPQSQQGTLENFQFPQQFSLFYAGEITPHMGAFIQVTHTDNSGGFAMDNSEIRYADHFAPGKGDLLLGIVANNNPSMSDVWQTTPVWGYPFQSPLGYEKPLSWSLGQSVGGIGAYALYDSNWYAEVMFYKTMGSGGQDTALASAPWSTIPVPAGGTPPGAAVGGWAPYARLAYTNTFGQNTLEVGAFGMHTRLYDTGTGTSGPTDAFTDLAIDAQYERPFGDDSIVVRAVAAHEKISLDGYRVAVPTQPDASFRVFNLNGSYHFGSDKLVSAAYVRTTGDAADAATYAAGLRTGTKAAVLEAAYYPWENVRLSAQYVAYSQYLGVSNNASDNNTIYLLAWLVF